MPINKRVQAVDKKQGVARVFWKNVDKRDDGKWIWTGAKNTNHNTVDCEKYEYGNFALEDRIFTPISKVINSEMAHHVMLFLTFGEELDTGRYEVTPINGDHLDINPENLAVRDKSARHVVSASEFFAAGNMELAVAA